MTLADLQEIGREVDISPELVAHAARSLDRGRSPPLRTFLGLPIGVGRTIELEPRLSEEDWERLVTDLRETFDARGTVRYDGPFRQWTNGNLQALLEPTATGHRLRIRTVKGSARELVTAGFVAFGVALAALLASAATDRLGETWPLTVFLAAFGLGTFGFAALRLPVWARRRQRQMEGIIERLTAATATALPNDPSAEQG